LNVKRKNKLKYHHIESPLEGESYLCLLNWAKEISSCFSLVWRNDFKFKRSADKITKKLRNVHKITYATYKTVVPERAT
ncbi:MAG: hypothetical protein WBN77_07630, partial [Desulfobacterales bacterium]